MRRLADLTERAATAERAGAWESVPGIPVKIKVYDDGGKSFDRYTVVTDEPYASGKPGYFSALGLSDNPTHPQGFSQWTSAQDGPHLGKRIAFADLPKDLQRHVIQRMRSDESVAESAGERPPKSWMDSCLRKVKGDDPGAICGNIWHNVMGPASRKRAKKRGAFESTDILGDSGLPADEADLDEAMTKKHFQRIADILRPRAEKAEVKEIARELAAFFSSENPQFDTARFLKAAGLHGTSARAIAASADEAVVDEALSKKHFARVAQILRFHRNLPAVAEIAKDLSKFFKEENPNFDEERFLSAAGLTSGVGALSPTRDEDLDEAARPPKAWMDSCLARQEANPKIKNAGAVCAEIWRGMGPEGQRRAKRRGAFEASEDAPRGPRVPWADDPELGGLDA